MELCSPCKENPKASEISQVSSAHGQLHLEYTSALTPPKQEGKWQYYPEVVGANRPDMAHLSISHGCWSHFLPWHHWSFLLLELGQIVLILLRQRSAFTIPERQHADCLQCSCYRLLKATTDYKIQGQLKLPKEVLITSLVANKQCRGSSGWKKRTAVLLLHISQSVLSCEDAGWSLPSTASFRVPASA